MHMSADIYTKQDIVLRCLMRPRLGQSVTTESCSVDVPTATVTDA